MIININCGDNKLINKLDEEEYDCVVFICLRPKNVCSSVIKQLIVTHTVNNNRKKHNKLKFKSL